MIFAEKGTSALFGARKYLSVYYSSFCFIIRYYSLRSATAGSFFAAIFAGIRLAIKSNTILSIISPMPTKAVVYPRKQDGIFSINFTKGISLIPLRETDLALL